MLDDQLREQLAAWARDLAGAAPPDVAVIRRRAHRRAIRRAAGSTGAAVLIVLGGLALAGHLTRQASPVPAVSGLPTFTQAPYYVTINPRQGTAAVYRTASGAVITRIKPPHGTSFISVAPAPEGQTFILASRAGQVIRFATLHLGPHGRAEPLESTSIPPLPVKSGSCEVQLAGLAPALDGHTLAISTLTDCGTGTAGPGKIEIVSLSSGRVLNELRPGNGYPESLSWTAGGALAYDWAGPQPGVWLIGSAAQPGSRPHLLIPESAGLGAYNGEQYPIITPDGSAVIATLGRGSAREVAEFSARTGTARRALIPAVTNPAEYCGLLWTDPTGQHLLAACGEHSESSIDNGHLTHLPPHWQLPTYPVPSGPQIAW